MVNGTDRRVAFFHIPKTGTSLGNMIAHYVNTSLPAEAVIPNCAKEACSHVESNGQGQLEFQYRYPSEVWFNNCLWIKDGRGPDRKDWFSHKELEEKPYEEFKGRFVGLFRDPKQRAISSFYSFTKSREEQYKIFSKEKWARLIEGTATKMLAGQDFPIETEPLSSGRSYIKPNLELAISRLSGFMFIGLVEHFALSVCLFHKITDTKCATHDVDNMRKSNKKTGKFWDESELNGYVDPYDTALYLEAKKMFWNSVTDHNLTAWKCKSMCPWMNLNAFDIPR